MSDENKSTKVFRTLAETFDVEDVVDKRAVSVVDPVVEVPEDNTVDSDADAVRDTLYNLLKKGEEAFEDLKRIAVAEESPRSFEVLNSMLGQLSDIAVKLMDVHEKKNRIKKASVVQETAAGAVNNGTVNNNTVFVGTTADLQEMIKRINLE
jgi:uncharacterized protein YicC (UPF0701 family)